MIHIVGAGPGDPELITVKGARYLAEADVVIYAGSLVNPALLDMCKAGAEIHNSAHLHTGDPAIYGAIQEQMDAWEKRGFDYDVVPGVSSFLGTAAALRQEYTLPGISQTVIITRNEGRTPVPEREKLRSLAAHHATMCIFLSISMIEDVVAELIAGGYEETTPIAIVQRATWPEQKILRGTLSSIAEQVKSEEIDRTAMIVVGDCLDTEYNLSQLYAPSFSHMFREAKS